MNLNGRLNRLTAALARKPRALSPGDTYLTPEERVTALRQLCVHCGIADPAPWLEGEEYLAEFRRLRGGNNEP